MIRWRFVFGFLGLLAVSFQANAQSALTHASGNVEVAVTDFGSLGAVRERAIAPNFEFPKSGGAYYLHERSEIWVGDADGNVANAWGWDSTDQRWFLDEWRSTAEGTFAGGVESDGRQNITVQYASSGNADFPLNLLVNQQSFSWRASDAPGAEDFIVIRLTVTNNGDTNHDGIYIAMMANWDVDTPATDGAEASLDRVGWDEGRRTLFTYDADDSDEMNPVYTGLTLLDGELSTHQIFPFGVNLFADVARSRFMSDPSFTERTGEDLPPRDYASILTAGPYTLQAKESVSVTFALLAGESLADLQENIDEAWRISYAPQRLTAEALRDAVKLEWEQSINPSIGGYAVFRQDAGGGALTRLDPPIITGNSFEDRQIAFGTEYTYLVRPVDSTGQPLPFDSREVSVKPDVIPTPPRNVTAVLSENQIRLTWTKSSQPVTGGYIIYRNHTGREPWTQIKVVSPESVNFIDADVYSGLSYFYTIAAANSSSGQSEFSTVVNAALPGEVVSQPESNLENVIVVPNPYSIHTSSNPIEFRNLTRHATIRIYNSAGELIKRIEHHGETPTEQWDGRIADGSAIMSGIYIYHVEALRETGRGRMSASGKFAVIR